MIFEVLIFNWTHASFNEHVVTKYLVVALSLKSRLTKRDLGEMTIMTNIS